MGYGYSYNYDYGMSDSVFAAFMSIYLIIFMVALIFWIVEYVFFAIGLYTIAKRMGKNYPWLAFIPFARKYLHGELAGTIELKAKKIKNPGIWKLVLPIISGAVFSFFMIIIMIAFGIGTFMGMSAYGYGVSGGTILLAVVLLLIMAVAAVLYQAAYRVLCVLVDVRIYERFTTHNMGIAHAVISALIPLYEACCLFAMRNKEFNPGMEPELPPPPAPLPPVYPGNPVPPKRKHLQRKSTLTLRRSPDLMRLRRIRRKQKRRFRKADQRTRRNSRIMTTCSKIQQPFIQ